jgi:hypothetical protein
MAGFQDLTSWIGRDPYAAGASGRPSLDALNRLKALKGVSPNAVPYSPDEMDIAFGQQADEAAGRMQDWQSDPTQAGSMSPALERARGNALGGGHWADFSDAIDRSAQMAANRGMRFGADLVGRGPGTGTGVGRWEAQPGHADPFGSFTPDAPSIDLENLASDATSAGVNPYTRSTALGALRRLTRGE